MVKLAALLDILQLAGAETPAFLALYNQVVATLSAADQATLKDAYTRAQVASDAQHAAAQSTGKAK